jgi:hypothetical protein
LVVANQLENAFELSFGERSFAFGFFGLTLQTAYIAALTLDFLEHLVAYSKASINCWHTPLVF